MRYAPGSAAVVGIGMALLVGTTQAQSPTTRPTDARILVLPFRALNASESQAWLGRSIQQSILADLTTAAPGRMMSADVEATDMSAAAEAGRKAGAAYVVQGSFTTIPAQSGAEMRLLGQVIDVNGGRPITAFKATGPYNDIFRLEDQVANQIRSRLAGAGVLAAPVVTALTSPPRVDEQVAALPQVNEYWQEYGTAPQAYAAGTDQGYYNYYYAAPAYGGYGYGSSDLGLGLGTSFFFGSFFPHGSRFGGFDHDRFGVHHGHGGFEGHSGGSHGGAGVSSGGGRASGGHR